MSLFFDGLRRYGIEIMQEDEKFFLRYRTGDWTDSLDRFEITKEEAEKIKSIYAPLDDMDIRNSEEGKNALKSAVKEIKPIIYYYWNKRAGLS